MRAQAAEACTERVSLTYITFTLGAWLYLSFVSYFASAGEGLSGHGFVLAFFSHLMCSTL